MLGDNLQHVISNQATDAAQAGHPWLEKLPDFSKSGIQKLAKADLQARIASMQVARSKAEEKKTLQAFRLESMEGIQQRVRQALETLRHEAEEPLMSQGGDDAAQQSQQPAAKKPRTQKDPRFPGRRDQRKRSMSP